MQGIFSSLDWYSCMFVDVSINEVISWVGLDPKLTSDEFLMSQHERCCGFDDSVVWSYNHVSIEAFRKCFTAEEWSEFDISFFDRPCAKIRLDLSGQGLAFLRQTVPGIEDKLRDEKQLLFGQHVTRVDFAFDFVNYKGDLVDQLIDYCRTNHTDSDRLCCVNREVAYKYSVRTGSQKTVYVGSNTSERMLRVYDKRLQYTDPSNTVYVKEDPYEHPETWCRIEWQLRNMWAMKVLFGQYPDEEQKDFLHVLRLIFDVYSFADLSTPNWRREPIAFWQDVFSDWKFISAIIQNKNVVHKIVNYLQQVEDAEYRFYASFVRSLCLFGGIKAFQKRFNDYLSRLQHFDKSDNPEGNSRRWRSLLDSMIQIDPDILKYLSVSQDSVLYFDVHSELRVDFTRAGRCIM